MVDLRRFIAAFVCMAMIAAGMSPVVSAAELPFPDMEQSWFAYRDSVAYLKGKNVIGGYEDGTFRPNATVNRAEFLKIVFAARGGPRPVEGSCFPDVVEGSWYAPFVCAAARRGIVNGYPDGTFHPDDPVNIAEALKIVLKAYGQDTGKEKSGEHWYDPYVSYLDRADILRRSSYLPWAPLTRERAADVIVRVLKSEDGKHPQSASKGCSVNTTASDGKVIVQGQERTFLLDVPSGNASEPRPLIVAFHGRTNAADRVRGYYGLTREARDYIVAYPQALETKPGSHSWVDPQGKFAGDIPMFDAVVEDLANRYCIDLDRIYVVGHSLGAWMANTVACVRGGIVRASATVGGDGANVTCAGPTAALNIHHQRDNLASFASAARQRDHRLKTNACSQASRPVAPELWNCIEYEGCDRGSDVVWCPHEIDIDGQGNNYPHQWPEGAGREIVKFFEGL